MNEFLHHSFERHKTLESYVKLHSTGLLSSTVNLIIIIIHQLLSKNKWNEDFINRLSNKIGFVYDVAKLDKETFVLVLDRHLEAIATPQLEATGKVKVKSTIDPTMDLTWSSYYTSVPREKVCSSRHHVSWWTNEITQLRRTALIHRRRAQRDWN